MKAQLVKHASGYILFDEKGIPIGATPNVLSNGTFSKLSLKNCQAIERGYDLDELVENHTLEVHNASNGFGIERGIVYGFQKAVELMGDKKFTEEDVLNLLSDYGYDLLYADKLFEGTPKQWMEQSLQQTEWEVTFNPDELDADGCLILKRI